MAPVLAAALITAGTGAVQAGAGIAQKNKAARMAKKNIRPNYTIPKEIKENVAIASSRAQQGISDAAKQTYKQEAEHGLTAAISAITNNGGSVNNIGDLYGNYQEGIGRMAIIDDEMRVRNVNNLILANKDMADAVDKEFQINKWAPYADTAQAAAALSKQGNDNIWKGVNTIVGAGVNYATANMYKDEAANVFGAAKNAVDMAPPPPVRRERGQIVTMGRSIQDKYPGLAGLSTPVPLTTFNNIMKSRMMLQPNQIPSKDAATPQQKPIDWSNYNFLEPVNNR